MSLTSSIKVHLFGELLSALDVGSASYKPSLSPVVNLSDGTGENQANMVFTDTRTLSASASEDLDLAGGLTNAFGATVTFTKVKALLITAASGNTNNVLVGGASSAQMASMFGDASDVVVVRRGGMFMVVAPDSTGYAVTATTADLLKIANSSSGSSVTYTIAIIGTV